MPQKSTLQDYEADPHTKWAGVGLLHCVASHCTTMPWDCMQRLLKEGLQVPLFCRKVEGTLGTPGIGSAMGTYFV